jgi:transcriptional regulator GlxA family with amidase domain
VFKEHPANAVIIFVSRNRDAKLSLQKFSAFGNREKRLKRVVGWCEKGCFWLAAAALQKGGSVIAAGI